MSISYCQLSPSLTPSTPSAMPPPPSSQLSSQMSSDHHHQFHHLNNNNNTNFLGKAIFISASSSSITQPPPRIQPPPPPQRISTLINNNRDVGGGSLSTPPLSEQSPPVPIPRRNVSNNNNHQNKTLQSHESESINQSQQRSNEALSSSDCPSDLHTGTNSSNLTSGATTPSVYNWQRDFGSLINDPEGLRVFREYIIYEMGRPDLIDFYFACESVECPENHDSVARLARAILRRYLLRDSKLLRLSDSVKDHLIKIFPKLPKTVRQSNAEMNANETETEIKFDHDFYLNLFQDAKNEVYQQISTTFYGNFLRSEFYLKAL